MARATPQPLTDAHLRAAFEAMHWPDTSFEAAMADKTRKAVISWRARQICDAEHRAQQRRRVVTYCATTGDPNPLRSAAPGRRWWPVQTQDLKRLAAGDRDD